MAKTRPLVALPIHRLGAVERRNFRDTFGYRPAVKDSEDLQRILAIPLRAIPDATALEALRDRWTRTLSIPSHYGQDCGCPITKLNASQAWYLEEAHQNSQHGRGVIGALKIGTGKTGCDILVPMVMAGVKNALLLIPPRLRAQFASDFKVWARHFRVPNLAGSAGVWFPDRPVLRVLSYSELSAKSGTTYFASHPDLDLVICDECQRLKNRNSAGGDRFLRHFADGNKNLMLCAHSGSLTTREIQDYFHLSALALREYSPLPIDPTVAEEWGGVLNPQPDGMIAPVGAMRKLCEPDEEPKDAFYRRRNQTPGFITSADARLPVKLGLRVRDPGPLPPSVEHALYLARSKAERLDGEQLQEAAEQALVARQAAVGLFMRWKYPRGEPEELILRWFAARKAYNREVRERLERRYEHLDSPGLCDLAAARAAAGYEGPLPVWHSTTWGGWNEVKDLVKPVSDTVWIDDFLVRDAAAWAQEAPGIVFCDHPLWGHALAKMTKLPYFGGGPVADLELTKEKGDRSVICSLKANGTGKNLQCFNRTLIVDLPSDAGIVEQAIGRTYREGQKRDVIVEFYQHTEEFEKAWESVIALSEYASKTQFFAVLFADRLPTHGRASVRVTG